MSVLPVRFPRRIDFDIHYFYPFACVVSRSPPPSQDIHLWHIRSAMPPFIIPSNKPRISLLEFVLLSSLTEAVTAHIASLSPPCRPGELPSLRATSFVRKCVPNTLEVGGEYVRLCCNLYPFFALSCFSPYRIQLVNEIPGHFFLSAIKTPDEKIFGAVKSFMG